MDSIERQLERAFTIALKAHERQVDKAGQPYLTHLVRVMLRVDDGPARVVALLHDLLEDTNWTAEDLLREGFDPAIVEAVVALTRREDETYMQYIERLMPHPLAVRVKLADLAQIDPQKAMSLGQRCRKAYDTLGGVTACRSTRLTDCHDPHSTAQIHVQWKHCSGTRDCP